MRKIITIAIIIIVIIAIIFIKTNYNSLKFGNNTSNKSTDKIVEYILDIQSYKANEDIKIESNKNVNKYKTNEQYVKENNISKTEILEPENVKGVTFTFDGSNLTIQNTKLNLSNIFENYKYIGENSISLIGFINDYKESTESKMTETDDEIILETKLKNGTKYYAYKKLYISKQTAKPTKLEIRDITQKTIIYILYNEIEINNLQKEDVLAFKLEEITNDI